MHIDTSSYPILNLLPEGIVIVDVRGVIHFANEAFGEMIGYNGAMLTGLNILSLLSDVERFGECMAAVMKEGTFLDDETDFLHCDGSLVRTVKSVRMVRKNGTTRLFVSVRNLSETDRINRELRHSHNLIETQAGELSALLNSKHQELEEILRSIREIIWYIDSQTLTVQYVNEAVSEVFGFSRELFLSDATLWQRQIHPDDRTLVKLFFETLLPGHTQQVCFRVQTADGRTRWLSNRIYHHEKLGLFIGVTGDVTEARYQKEEITFLAYHDPLTQLPNRAKLKEKLDAHFEHAPNDPFTLMFLDLDNFKNINDAMGHDTGDKILVDVSRRFRERIEKNDFCARFGGDEFVLVLMTSDSSEIERFCARLFEAFNAPFTARNIHFTLSASIGIVTYPDDARNAEDLIRYADRAMYEAKKMGKNRYACYHPSMQHTVADLLPSGESASSA